MLPKAQCCRLSTIRLHLPVKNYTENYIVLLPLENETGYFLDTCLYAIIYYVFFLKYLLLCIHNLIEDYLNLWGKTIS